MRLTVMIKHGRKNALQPIKEISEDSLFCLLYVIPIPRASTSGCACYILQTNELTWVVKNAVTCGHRSLATENYTWLSNDVIFSHK